ncbi:unannotated protein [freshwater metagenome]|uniref:Unannotated protein n=1 Tax=freshwater metagenome TaxID=449393 RepID=A0A6J7ESK0_9ZZZZ
MIHEGGLDALSMRALAQRVGVSVTTLYNLFDTREAIVRAALDQVLAELVPLVSSLKPTTDLGQLCDNSASIIDATLNAMTGPLLLAVMNDPTNARRFIVGHRATEAFVPFLHEAQDRAELTNPADFSAIATAFEAVVYAAGRMWAMGLIESDERNRRIRSGIKVVLLAYATPLGRRALQD